MEVLSCKCFKNRRLCSLCTSLSQNI